MRDRRGTIMSVVFIFVSIVLFIAILFYIPKQLTKREMFTTSFFALSLQQTIDIYLALKYNLYGYFGGGIQYITLVSILGIYPAINLLYLNLFPYYRGVLIKTIYIAAWTTFALFYEWLSVLTGFFYHHGWKYWHSLIVYPMLFLALSLALWSFRKLGD
jgi:hypothetical protein